MNAVSVAGIAVQGNRLFIARRLPGGDLGEKWEFPGGKAEKGESCGEALIREFREEFGVTVTVGPRIASASFEHRGVVRELRACLVRFNDLNFVLNEHSAWKWADFAEIEKLDFAGSDRKLFPALKVYLERNPGI
ncbi:MAG: NUDIX domain-containing protein [Spirochaetaceae bacterium]|jgi:8-oxo-dGTP diphosphatase|nr:NUDIX domain-containing protein [Spirochaetaceae bacterium]